VVGPSGWFSGQDQRQVVAGKAEPRPLVEATYLNVHTSGAVKDGGVAVSAVIDDTHSSARAMDPHGFAVVTAHRAGDLATEAAALVSLACAEPIAPVEYNYRDQAQLEVADAAWRGWSDEPGMSAFALEDGVVYHTYSAYARGLDVLWAMLQWLDRAPLGCNEGDLQ
jgi:hypothetical protein